MPAKRGDMVRVIREKLENSVEAKASDARFPDYLFDSKGEIVDIKGDYAFVKFGKSTNAEYLVTFRSIRRF